MFLFFAYGPPKSISLLDSARSNTPISILLSPTSCTAITQGLYRAGGLLAVAALMVWVGMQPGEISLFRDTSASLVSDLYAGESTLPWDSVCVSWRAASRDFMVGIVLTYLLTNAAPFFSLLTFRYHPISIPFIFIPGTLLDMGNSSLTTSGGGGGGGGGGMFGPKYGPNSYGGKAARSIPKLDELEQELAGATSGEEEGATEGPARSLDEMIEAAEREEDARDAREHREEQKQQQAEGVGSVHGSHDETHGVGEEGGGHSHASPGGDHHHHGHSHGGHGHSHGGDRGEGAAEL